MTRVLATCGWMIALVAGLDAPQSQDSRSPQNPFAASHPATRASAASPAASSPIARATVQRTTDDGAIVVLQTKSTDAIRPRSRAYFFDGMRLIGRGTVVVTRGEQIGARVETSRGAAGARTVLKPGTAAAIIPSDIVRRVRDRWPERVALSFAAQTTSESGRTAWLAGGEDDGLQAGDTLLAEHSGWPVARLTLFRLEPRAALAGITLLVGNGAVAAGDDCRLWPTPREAATGRIHSRVMRVLPRGTDQDVWIPAASANTSTIGDHWEIRRRGSYVGLVEIREATDRFVIGTAFAAFCRSPIALGDDAIRRPAADITSGRTPMVIFRAEGDECLVSGGQSDGLTRDMDLTVVREGKEVARLTVTTLNLDHVGARIREGSRRGESGPRPWDEVFVSPVRARTELRGRVTEAHGSDGLVEFELDGGACQEGQIVVVDSQGGAWAAIVVTTSETRAVAAPITGAIPGAAVRGDNVVIEHGDSDGPSR